MFISVNAAETKAVGERLAREIQTGDVLALVGDLGAGKTQFVKGLAKGLGSAAVVTSPTFTLVHEYQGSRLPIYHFDFYRLRSAQEIIQLGFDDYVFGDGITLIEWADRYPDLIPRTATWISFVSQAENSRMIAKLDER